MAVAELSVVVWSFYCSLIQSVKHHSSLLLL